MATIFSSVYFTITVDVNVITPHVYVPTTTTTSASSTASAANPDASPKAIKDSDEFLQQCKLDSITVEAGKISSTALP